MTDGTIKVTVLDEPFRIASEADSEYTREVAAHVDRTLRSLRKSAPTLESFPTAVLGAMEITDDLLKARREGAALVAELDERIARLGDLVDQVLALEPVWGGEKNTGRQKRPRKETGAR